MDGVSGAFAVVSLAIQLVETGEKISSFLASVQDAPNEVSRLCQSVDQLNGTLKQVSYLLEQQYLILRLPGSPVFITNALENCEKRIKMLENVISKARIAMDHKNRVLRSWAAIKFGWKKEDVREMQSQFRDAEAGLRTAMLSNSWQLQMHSISVSSSSDLQATTNEQPSLARPIQSVSRYEKLPKQCSTHTDTIRANSKETHSAWYRGYFGRVDIHVKSTSLSASKSRRTGNRAVSEEKTIKITPAFLRKTLELRLLSSFGQVSRTLKIYPILKISTPIFSICKNGDLGGLQAALSSGTISPFVTDEYGWSLLHYAANAGSLDTCALLLQLGVDSGIVDLFGWKAFHRVNRQHGAIDDKGKVVELMRVLIQSQDVISAQDLHRFWAAPGTVLVEAAEFMSSQDLIPSESDVSDDEEVFPILATALREFGTDPSQWESFLRLLLRQHPDLHSPVPRFRNTKDSDELFNPMFPCRILEYGTPLDDLFMFTKTPFEGEAIAHRWLRVLSSEGFDLVAYLEEEFALHAEQMQLIRPSLFQHYASNVPRQLLYQWGSNPSVSWDWWIDPHSCAYLVRDEFKYMDILDWDHRWRWDQWEEMWPLRHPESSDYIRFYRGRTDDPELQLLHERAQERANRRWEKKSMKTARAQGLKKRDQMPGAWPV